MSPFLISHSLQTSYNCEVAPAVYGFGGNGPTWEVDQELLREMIANDEWDYLADISYQQQAEMCCWDEDENFEFYKS